MEFLREVVFEEGSALRKIGQSAFQSCSNLKRICLPDGLERIGNACFLCSSLEEIAIPSSVTVIGNGAFSYCEGLKKVTF